MNRIFAKRYAFCDFSSIYGYPHPVNIRDEWEHNISIFRGEEWEVPAEHLLDFHEFIHRLQIIHEDVQIELFRYSLEGIALDWFWSLSYESVSPLVGFHATFNFFCKDYFSFEHLFEGCCEEFSSYHEDFACHKNQISDKASIAEDSIYHEDQEMLNDIDYDNSDIEAYDIISDVSIVLNDHEDQYVSFSDVKEQGYTSVEDTSYCDRGIVNPHYENHGDSFKSAVDAKGNPHFPNL
jgi:hypothetical protein